MAGVVPFDGTRDDVATALAVRADRKIVVVGGGTNAAGFNGKKALKELDVMSRRALTGDL